MAGFRFALFLAVLLLAGPALGNGAFPDSQAVLTPEDWSQQILLSTNFGLITSNDGGGTWTWSCEQDPNGRRNLYQLGPPPRHRLFARDLSGLVFTDDLGCNWTAATGALVGSVISDAFPIQPARIACSPLLLLAGEPAGAIACSSPWMEERPSARFYTPPHPTTQ